MYLSNSVLIKGILLSGVILLSQRTTAGRSGRQKRSCGVAKNVQCAVRPQIVHLPKEKHDEIKPNTVWVNRCSGGCDGSLRNCTATESKPKKFKVYSVHGKKCIEKEVEEHTKCECGCIFNEETCKAMDQAMEFNKEQCICECKNKDAEWICAANGKVWDKRNCKCKCPYERECPTGEIWLDSDCRCVVNEEYYED